MGAEMTAGKGLDLWSRNECALVSGWCWPFEGEAHRKKMSNYDMMGLYEHTPEAVRAADAAIPSTFDEAKRCGVDLGGGSSRPVDEDDFMRAREFLRCAAACGGGISGGC